MDIQRRTSRKSAEKKSIKKMLSMKSDIWEKADQMADQEGITRSEMVAQAIMHMWEAWEKERQDAR